MTFFLKNTHVPFNILPFGTGTVPVPESQTARQQTAHTSRRGLLRTPGAVHRRGLGCGRRSNTPLRAGGRGHGFAARLPPPPRRGPRPSHTPDRTLPSTPRRTMRQLVTDGPAHAQVARMATAPAGDADEDAMVRPPRPSRRARVPYNFPDNTPHVCQKPCLGRVLTPAPESGRCSYHPLLRHNRRRSHPSHWARIGGPTVSARLAISSTCWPTARWVTASISSPTCTARTRTPRRWSSWNRRSVAASARRRTSRPEARCSGRSSWRSRLTPCSTAGRCQSAPTTGECA